MSNHSVRVAAVQCCKKGDTNWTNVGSTLHQYMRATKLSMRSIARLPRHELSSATATALALNGSQCGQYGGGSLDPLTSLPDSSSSSTR